MSENLSENREITSIRNDSKAKVRLRKQKFLQRCTDAVNVAGGNDRSGKECRKRWLQDLSESKRYSKSKF